MSDYSSLDEIGGLQLAEYYPDRGLITDSPYYHAILAIEPDAIGIWDRLRSFEISTHRFGAVLSGNADGLRLVVSLEQFVLFIPWTEATVSGERSLAATRVRLRTAAVPSLTLEFHLDDTAADDLFAKILAPLPRREPPRRMGSFKPWALVNLVFILLAIAALLAAVRL